MAKPSRKSTVDAIRGIERTFFVTTKTIQGQFLLQSERMATLLIDVLRSYMAEKKFTAHDFVVMPNHLHALVTIDDEMTIEKVMQLIKGGFSYRAKKEVGFTGEIWQPGFSEVRIQDRPSFLEHREYIDQNSVKAGLSKTPEEYPYGSAYLKAQKRKKTAKGS